MRLAIIMAGLFIDSGTVDKRQQYWNRNPVHISDNCEQTMVLLYAGFSKSKSVACPLLCIFYVCMQHAKCDIRRTRIGHGHFSVLKSIKNHGW